MSLLVNVYTISPEGKMLNILHPENHAEELAGFESYRQKLYGSKAAHALGLKLLPTLAGSDIYAQGDDLIQLRAEAELALANIELFELEAEANSADLHPRFENIIAATTKATALKGGVVIW